MNNEVMHSNIRNFFDKVGNICCSKEQTLSYYKLVDSEE
jgi:hypothetical protein